MTEKKRRNIRKPKPNVFGITEEWQNIKDITTDPRGLKRIVRDYNNHFGDDEEHQYYIVSGVKGYRLTQDEDEIIRSVRKEFDNANTRFEQARKRNGKVRDVFSKNGRLPI